jgi:hypothetical protein
MSDDALIEIVVTPVGKSRFEARLAVSGHVLGTFSAPLCGAARVLLSERIQPETEIQMRHAASDVIALRSTVGVAAGLTVVEATDGKPRFAKWMPFDMARAAE